MPKTPARGVKSRPTTRRGRAAKAKAKAKAAESLSLPRTGMLAGADEIKRRIGRPKFQVTDRDRAFVKKLSALGVSVEEIAGLVGCERHTLTRWFRQDIDDGRIEATAAVSAALFAKATAKGLNGASVRAAEIWLRRFPEWLEAERPRNRDDEAGDKEIVVTGGLPERQLQEIPVDDDGTEGGA